MRGSNLRTIWRARYLPLNRPAFWLTLAGFAQFLGVTATLTYIVLARPDHLVDVVGATAAVLIGLPYLG